MLWDCPSILDQTHAKNFYTVCLLSITAEIDIKKLPFLGRLCELKTLYMTMRICIVRLFSYLSNASTKHYGLILDIISIPWKYNLYQVLTDDLESGFFPKKCQVKTSAESFMISFHSVCLAILILLNSTSFVHANHLSICEKFLIIIKLFCVNVAVDPPRYPTRIVLPLSKICYERIRAFYYTLP